jgi:hypothetical protein
MLAACWTSAPEAVQKRPVTEPTADEDGPERHATVRIDDAPGGKRFQGVWLEFPGGTRWVVDYRPTPLWKPFEDEAVVVTGRTYQPRGQAINATHFRVARMRLAGTVTGGRPGSAIPGARAVPYRAFGPEQFLRGTFVEHVWPAGTRREGEAETEFRTDLGVSYGIAGGDVDAGPAAIRARVVEIDPAYAATTGGPKLYVLSVHPHDHVP